MKQQGYMYIMEQFMPWENIEMHLKTFLRMNEKTEKYYILTQLVRKKEELIRWRYYNMTITTNGMFINYLLAFLIIILQFMTFIYQKKSYQCRSLSN